MLIGVISDTHDNLRSLQKAIDLFKQHKVEMIIHCGDWVSPFVVEYLSKNTDVPIKGVLGNNKGDIKRIMQKNAVSKNPVEFPKRETLELTIDGRKAIIYHGEDENILNALITSHTYAIIFTGHTHAARNETIDNVLIVNPGTTCYAREGEILNDASIAIYNSQTNSAEIITF